MNEHVTIGNRLCLLPGVTGMYSMSDYHYGPALRVTFRNGCELSIVANPKFGRGMRYASGKLLEIAVFTPEGEFTREFFNWEAYDDVLGYLDKFEILAVGENIAKA
jgi:hypothetical protein